MLRPKEQEPAAVLKALDPIIPVVYRALERGTQEAKDFFDSRGETVDSYLYPCLVRYFAKLSFEAEGQKVTEFNFGRLANNGLLLTFEHFRLRILKSDRGDLPVPGPSRLRQRFYWQPALFGHSLKYMNLVVLWDTPNGLLDDLMLVCPKSGRTTKESVAINWKTPIPHPAVMELPPAILQDTPAEDDLPNIGKPPSEETGYQDGS